MKRLLFIMMAVILVVGLMVSGCGEKETLTPTPSPTLTGEPAAFILSNLSIQPAEIDIDGEVTISVLIKNTGDLEGSYEVNLSVNDEIIEFKTVTLDGGAEQTVTFTTIGSSIGTFAIKVNDLSGTFTVKAPSEGTTVYVSVSVDGELLVAAQPVIITDMTVEAAIKAAHTAYFSGGESGYTAGIDPTFNIYLVSQCWGIEATPFVILNGAPLGADPSIPPFVDAAPVAANDNIIICTSSDPMNNPATPVSLTSTLSGNAATVTATAWTLDFTTFMYSSAPLANANVVDPTTGASLGTTDADGSITVTVPESGIVAIEGLAAINVKTAPTPSPTPTPTPTPSPTPTPTPTPTPSPTATETPPAGTTVYVSVSVDGELLVAAQPVTVTELTLDGAIKAAHAAYYSGGESGYTAGIDPTWNMYLITQCWGVEQTPFVILNDKPLGADPSGPLTVDAAPVAANDNIIICTSSVQGAAQPVSLTATLSGDTVTVTATAWTLNMATFQYTHAPLADANVIDPTTGASLGTTDADGSITVTVPESGIVAIEGLAAINVEASATTT